jgi:ceramide glucosyltransferase
LGHLGSGLIFAIPYGLLGFLAAAWMGHIGLGAVLLAVAIANRLIEAWVIGWGITRDPRCLRAPWLYLVRDLLGFIVWCASYGGQRTVWRNRPYKLAGGGRIALHRSSANGDAQK